MRHQSTDEEVTEIAAGLQSWDSFTRRVFIAEAAKRLGQDFDLFTRDPDTNETFDIGHKITDETLFFIARRYLRALAQQDALGIPLVGRRGASIPIFPSEIAKRMIEIIRKLKTLRASGIIFDIEHPLPESVVVSAAAAQGLIKLATRMDGKR